MFGSVFYLTRHDDLISSIMVQSNPAEQYQHRISDIIQRFVNSMRDSRARVDINSSREDGFCIVELTL